MRQIGTLPSLDLAKKFSDFLTINHIEHHIEEDHNEWVVWIFLDDEIQKAKKFLENFLKNPEFIYQKSHAEEAEQIRRGVLRDENHHRSKYIDVRTHWHKKNMLAAGPVTITLIAVSVIVALISRMGTDFTYIASLFMSETFIPNKILQGMLDGTLQESGLGFKIFGWTLRSPFQLIEVMQGQVWRIFTPAFVHFGFLHLLFNMMWLKDLGGLIENRKGSWFLIFLFLITAIPSNLGQFMVSGPSFGGMSGVVYGLLGYVWLKGKFDPHSRLALHKHIVIMMIAWFFLCLTGFMGNIANTAHGVGLVVGMIVGYLDARFFPTQ